MGKTLEKDRIGEMIEAITKVSRGDHSVQIALSGKNDDLDALAMGINMMIDDIRSAIEEIERERDYSNNIIGSMIDTLIVVNPDATIRTINRPIEMLLGYKEEELIGKPVGMIFEEEEVVVVFKGTRLKKLIEEGSVRDYDMTYKTRSGERIPVSFSGSVMRDKEGELVGIVGIAHDMREINRLME